MDNSLISRGIRRCSTTKFLAWLAPWAILLGFGVLAIGLCLIKGLNQTNMDNRFAFGLWIFLDLTVIALGAGAFFTGFLLYILRREELRAVINSAVVIGFICYSGAVLILAVDVGQPLRAWFTFWHPNVHSMLTEVTFCITCYLGILAIEYAPIVLKNRQLRDVPSFLVFEHQLHKVMPLFAAVGTFLSFFHQGSLGGLYGVLRGRPFAFRDGFAIWPSTFFLFILSAIATGPAFVLLTTWMVSKISGKQLVRHSVFALLAQISGWLLIAYVGFKSLDTLVWLNVTAPRSGVSAIRFYGWQPFASWMLVVEIVVLGLRAGADLPLAVAAPQHGLADHCIDPRVRRRGRQPLRDDDPDAGRADAEVRAVHALFPELAGDRRIRLRDRVRRDPLLVVIPLPDAVPAGAGAAEAVRRLKCFQESTTSIGTRGTSSFWGFSTRCW